MLIIGGGAVNGVLMPGDTLGLRVREFRENKGWSQRQLGMKASTSGSYISQIESGVIPKPGVDLIARIAAALGVSSDALIGTPGAEQPPSTPNEPAGAYSGDVEVLLQTFGDLTP